jgi:hypothetical protein
MERGQGQCILSEAIHLKGWDGWLFAVKDGQVLKFHQ